MVTRTEEEERYFARKEYEKLKVLAAKREAEVQAEERQSRAQIYFMHCPKCGGDLAEITYRDIHIDKCTSCAGIWLDDGELEQLLKEEDATIMRRVLKVFQK